MLFSQRGQSIGDIIGKLITIALGLCCGIAVLNVMATCLCAAGGIVAGWCADL